MICMFNNVVGLTLYWSKIWRHPMHEEFIDIERLGPLDLSVGGPHCQVSLLPLYVGFGLLFFLQGI